MIRLEPPISADIYSSSLIGEVVRAEQVRALGDAAPAWAEDGFVYATPWLAEIGEMTPEGVAARDADAARIQQIHQDQADREAAIAARDRVWSEARQRHLRLMVVAQERPEAGRPEEIVSIATDLDRPLPWRLLPSGVIVAANAKTVRERPHGSWSAPSDHEMAIAQMIVVAANTVAKQQTPAMESAPEDGEDAPLEETVFVQEIAVSLQDQLADLSDDDARAQAEEILHEFLTDNSVVFGDEGFDWTAAGAQTLADEWVAQNGEPPAAAADSETADETETEDA